MVRQLSTVLLSALIGSILGTLLLFAWVGGAGSANPARFFAAFAAATMIFTVPGAVLLMAMTFVLAGRLRQSQAAVILVIAGTLAGAAMLALLSLQPIFCGAVFGGLTAAAFVAVIMALRGYPGPRD